MILINKVEEVNVGDYILFTSSDNTIQRVYKIVKSMDSFIKELIYSSDKYAFTISKSIINNYVLSKNYWFLLNKEETDHYLKLSVFE